MRWDIYPLVGLGALRLGATMSHVQGLLGGMHPITASHTEFDGSVREYRGRNMPICIYENGELDGIDTNFSTGDIFFDGLDVYRCSARQVLLTLQKRSSGAKYFAGMILFENISINTNGFFDQKTNTYCDSAKNRTLGVFRARSFDTVLTHFADFTVR